jgi:hypothetical protein
MKSNLLTQKTLGLALVVMLAFVASSQADNIAPDGTGIIGKNDGTDLSTTGTEVEHAGSASDINDGVIGGGNSVNNFDYSGDSYGYVGIVFSDPITDLVSSLNLYSYLFSDGGYFGNNSNVDNSHGYNGTDPGNNLAASDLVAPEVQITLDGTTWTDVASTTNYDTALVGATVGSYPESTFTLDTPVTGIEGIRLIGLNGGQSEFVAVSELQVETAPEPSTYALMLTGLGMLALVARSRRFGKLSV